MMFGPLKLLAVCVFLGVVLYFSPTLFIPLPSLFFLWWLGTKPVIWKILNERAKSVRESERRNPWMVRDCQIDYPYYAYGHPSIPTSKQVVYEEVKKPEISKTPSVISESKAKAPGPEIKPRKIETREQKAERLIAELEAQGKPIILKPLAAALKVNIKRMASILKHSGWEQDGTRIFLSDGSQPHVWKRKKSRPEEESASRRNYLANGAKNPDLSGKNDQNEVGKNGL